jgi:hypothetical protein
VAGGEPAPALGDEPLEPVRVDLLGIERQLVAALARHHDPVAPERLAQPRDLDLDRLRSAGRRSLAPELVDQPIGAERLVAVEQEKDEERALPAPAQRDHPALLEHFERTEDAEIHM